MILFRISFFSLEAVTLRRKARVMILMSLLQQKTIFLFGKLENLSLAIKPAFTGQQQQLQKLIFYILYNSYFILATQPVFTEPQQQPDLSSFIVPGIPIKKKYEQAGCYSLKILHQYIRIPTEYLGILLQHIFVHCTKLSRRHRVTQIESCQKTEKYLFQGFAETAIILTRKIAHSRKFDIIITPSNHSLKKHKNQYRQICKKRGLPACRERISTVNLKNITAVSAASARFSNYASNMIKNYCQLLRNKGNKVRSPPQP